MRFAARAKPDAVASKPRAAVAATLDSSPVFGNCVISEAGLAGVTGAALAGALGAGSTGLAGVGCSGLPGVGVTGFSGVVSTSL